MRISKVKINNWKSVNELEIDCQDMMVLLGPNNHGKSNVLSAIGFMLTTGEKPCSEDFYSKRELKEDEPDELWVELTFSELTDNEQSTFKKYIDANGMLCVRKTATLEKDKVKVTTRYNGWLSQPQEAWLRGDYKAKKSDLQQELEGSLPEGKNFSQAVVVEAQQAYIIANKDALTFEYQLEKGSFLGQKNVAAGTLPEWFLIPAVRELTDETKTKSTATFGRLLTRAVQEMTAQDPKVREVQEKLAEMVGHLNSGDERPKELTELEKTIGEEMKDWDITLDIRVESPDISKVFELGTSLVVDDGVSTSAERKGNGMQRALILALTQAWVKALRKAKEEGAASASSRAASVSVILAIEEPELFLHPHAERKLYQSLRALGTLPEHQVFLTTHSTHFVDLDRASSICILQKSDAATGTKARQCQCELFQGNKKKQFNAAYWVNPNRGEMLFARRAVFVEGATEATLFPYLAEKLTCFDPEVSVIDCGGVDNLELYIELAKAFGLDFVVVHDKDPGKGAEKRNEDILALAGQAERVIVVDPDVEGVASVPPAGRSVGKPLAAREHFGDMNVQVPARLEEIVRAIYQKANA